MPGAATLPAGKTKWALLCARIRSFFLTFSLLGEFECGAGRTPANARDRMTSPRAPTSLVRFQNICNTAKRGFFMGSFMRMFQITGDLKAMKMWTRGSLLLIGVACACLTVAAPLPDVTELATEELGSTYGQPQMSGFVFIDGRYVAPPYTVTRRGNGIFINRIQVEQPVAWPRTVGAVTVGAEPVAKKTIDDDGDFEVVAPEQAQAAPAPAKTVKSIDDLFADEDEEEPVAVPVAPATTAVPAPAVKRMPEDIEREKAQTVEAIDRIRKGYEQALANGEIYFFGQRHHRVNGTYGSARTLMGVLPSALRQALSPQDLQQRLRQGGVYFIDLAICSELFKNKTTFPQLESRLRRIEEAEALEAQKRKASRGW